MGAVDSVRFSNTVRYLFKWGILNLCARPDLPYRLASPGEPFLLAADMDGTLLGDRVGEAWLRSLKRQSGGEFLLAYVTGRDFKSAVRAVDQGRLPRPDFICSHVGTEIFDLRDPGNALGEKYAAQVGPDWDPQAIYAMGEGEGVRRQAALDGKYRFQAGFAWDGRPRSLEAFLERMANLASSHILSSHGAYIDVLPEPMGKGKAVEFLQRELGLDPQCVVVAGDSGNDREMFETGFQGILPANALDELKCAAKAPRHYHSPLPAGRGVLDGLCRFGFLIEKM